MIKIYRGIANLTIATDDIEHLPNEVCEELECGDSVVKITGSQKHKYRVSYKEDGVGMCLTYDDASCVETVSYDFVDGAWVYNSTDVAHIGGEPAPSGTKLYKHTTTFEVNNEGDMVVYKLVLITNSGTSLAGTDLKNADYITAKCIYDNEDGFKTLVVDIDNYRVSVVNPSSGYALTDFDISYTTKKFLTDVVVEL